MYIKICQYLKFLQCTRNFIWDNYDCRQLQVNLIRSTAAGVGPALSIPRTRMIFALRVNVLAKGYSGISQETLQRCIDAFNCIELN